MWTGKYYRNAFREIDSLRVRDSNQMTATGTWLRMIKGYMIRFSLSVAILDMTRPSNSSTPTNGSCVVNISNYQNEIDLQKSWMNEMNGKDLSCDSWIHQFHFTAIHIPIGGSSSRTVLDRSKKISMIQRSSTGQLLNRLR